MPAVLLDPLAPSARNFGGNQNQILELDPMFAGDVISGAVLFVAFAKTAKTYLNAPELAIILGARHGTARIAGPPKIPPITFAVRGVLDLPYHRKLCFVAEKSDVRKCEEDPVCDDVLTCPHHISPLGHIGPRPFNSFHQLRPKETWRAFQAFLSAPALARMQDSIILPIQV